MTHELQRVSFVSTGDRPEGRWSVEEGPSLILERGREIRIQGGRFFALSPTPRQATITYNDGTPPKVSSLKSTVGVLVDYRNAADPKRTRA
jgi:hypothetical protein